MKQFSIYPPMNLKAPKAGQLLIAEPLLRDMNFTRSVILLCEHGEEGSVGFVLNQATDIKLGNLIKGIPSNGPVVYKGGPVQPDTLHLMHRVPRQLGGGKRIADGVYWGGSFDELYDLAAENSYVESDIRLFMGYSGWGPGQLEQEIKEGSWLIADVSEHLLFDTAFEDVWKQAIASLGRKYAHLAHIPTDPQLN
jgi:putative transcriptional regulator